jgi:hypothetical protein
MANDPLGQNARQSTGDVDAAALHKGRGRMLAAMIVAGLVALVGLAVYMSSGDEEKYSTFGKNINRIDDRYFDGFWGCALRGKKLADLKSDQDLRNELHRRAENGGQRYGAHLREECMGALGELESRLNALIPPDDLQPEVRDLVDAVERLRSAMSDYIGYLDRLEGAYDRDAATQLMTPIARAWYDYRKTHSAINTKLGEKLGRP